MIQFAAESETTFAEVQVGDFVEWFPNQQGIRGLRVRSGIKSITDENGQWGISNGRGRPRTPMTSRRITFLTGATISVPTTLRVIVRRRLAEQPEEQRA